MNKFDLTNINLYFVLNIIFANNNINFSNLLQQYCYTFLLFFLVFSFFSFEIAFKNNLVLYKKIIAKQNIDNILIKILYLVVRQIQKMQTK